MTTTRLTFFLSALPAGGLEQVTLTLIDQLAARGYAIDLLLEHRTGAYLEQVPASVDVIELERRSRWSGYPRFLTGWPREGFTHLKGTLGIGPRSIPLHRLAALVRYIETRQPNVMIATFERVPLLAIWARHIARHRMGLLVVEHSTFSHRLNASRGNTRAHALITHRRDLMQRLYPEADARIAVSEGVATDLANTLGMMQSAIKTIHNPVVSPRLHQQAVEAVSHPWFAPDAPPVIVTAGRLAPEKALHLLIDAFATLRASGRRARLMILGEGPERAALEARAASLDWADDIALPGWVDNPYAWIARSAVFVLSSVVEGLPTSLIEAMACGTPVVATDCPSGPREILADGRYGPLVPVRDHTALAQAIAQQLDAPTPSTELQTRANDFTVTHAVDAYQHEIERVCPVTPESAGR